MKNDSEYATVSTAALLTLTTGIVMVEGFAGVGKAAEAVTGHPVWTHEMGEAGKRAREIVPQQIPGFPTEATSDNWQAVRALAIGKYGETVEIKRGTDQRADDPLTTLDAKIAEARA